MKLDWIRTSLIVSIAGLCFILLIRWSAFQDNNAAIEEAKLKADRAQVVASAESDLAPPSISDDATTATLADETDDATMPSVTLENPKQVAVAQTKKSDTIEVRTDVLDVVIDLHGGGIVGISLPTYYAKLNTPDRPFVLMDPNDSHVYYALSGMLISGMSNIESKFHYNASQTFYTMDGETLNVDLTHTTATGLAITKRFTFTQGSYLVNISHIINNQSSQAKTTQVYGSIVRDDHDPVKSAGMGMKPFLGMATTTIDTNYDKTDFDDISENKQELKHDIQGGWIALVQHYFISAWIPDAADTNSYTAYKLKKKNQYVLQFVGDKMTVAPGTSAEKTIQFYAGPKDIHALEKISPHLDLTLDYSFLWWIAKPLFYALDFIHGFVGNWGIAIIILTILIKALFFYPSAASYRSMAKMRKVQPRMAELKERYGDNKQKLSSEMMKLYKDEKVNPLGGCLPIIIQMPVFMALYWVLMESVELRHAPFFLWIHDLSVKDPYFILPLIMGATMFIQQKLNPTPPDPMQAKVMQMMPIFFTFLFLFFPAGLVLYWVVNNSLSIAQQYVITKRIERS